MQCVYSNYIYIVIYWPKGGAIVGEKYTDAQKNASIKYLKEKTDSIQIRTPKGTKDRWRSAADESGVSLNKFIVEAVEAKIQTDMEK